jgi:hypothetical protein
LKALKRPTKLLAADNSAPPMKKSKRKMIIFLITHLRERKPETILVLHIIKIRPTVGGE